jgi:hypothetical protein
MLRALWWFVPDELLAIVLVLMGGGVMLGLVKLRTALTLLGFLLLLPFMDPIARAVFDLLPGWLVLLIVVALVLAMFRAAMIVLIGQGATDHMMGGLAAQGVRVTSRLVFWPVRAVFRRLM